MSSDKTNGRNRREKANLDIAPAECDGLTGYDYGKDVPMYGDIEEIREDENGIASLVIQLETGKCEGLLVTDMTYIDALIDNAEGAEAEALLAKGVPIFASGDISKKSLTDENGIKLKTYDALTMRIQQLPTDEKATLSDGTNVYVWRGSGYDNYRLADGTVLLRVDDSSVPENSYVGGVESLDDLSEAAKAGVLEFYDEQGLLYDVQIEL